MKDLYLHFFKSSDSKSIDDILMIKLQGQNFLFDKEKTEWYRKSLPNEKVFVIKMINNNYSPLLFFYAYNKNIYKLANINIDNTVTDDEFDGEYNNIINAFFNQIKRNKYFKATIIDTASDINKIITSKVCRDKLLFLLKAFPNSYHPFDIRRMDQFIWSIRRYSKKPIDLDALKEFLYKNEKLEKTYVDFLISRIRSGLQLLYAFSNKFNY